MKTSKNGLELIKSFEGCRLKAYKCASGVWTIGYGHTSGVKEGQVITQDIAEKYLVEDLAKFEKYVDATGLNLNQNQFDALVSFTYNCGNGNLKTLISNRTLIQIADMLLLYNKSNGKVLEGLSRRREAEQKLFLSSDNLKKVFNIHAGHNPDGRPACGAVGYIKESTEARRVKEEVIRMLRMLGHTVYDCTVDTGISAEDVLKKIVSKCNDNEVDMDISIHFNYADGLKSDGITTGTEVLVYSGYSKALDEANEVCAAISALGFKNRGVKYRPDLYFLKKTNAPAMLVECCFVNDKDDIKLYDHYLMAKAIVKGVTGETFEEVDEDYEEVVGTPTENEKYSIVFKTIADAEKAQKLFKDNGIDTDLVKA